ncbi:hypothetical protein QO009_002397 [Brevibacillus aydinogluensis]|uniref:DUF4179 domain-containing protein n=1 Tax=Brevibacillus aydinogluensis TaxID=927786 RepID=UPI002892C57B|nr:DUF4179 domain-containing protein [Brevibacillus aydinogluensis]MDT3416528.1 hypothetical protein [Brevibacillus aydinogluensis]
MRDWEQTEQQLSEIRERYQHVAVPEQADRYIMAGMAEARRRQMRTQRLHRIGWSALTACVLMLGLVFSIRLSPAVAAYVSRVPGLKPLVELIQYDKGLQMAAQHGLTQQVGRSAVRGKVSFTVDQVLMDQKRMLIVYTIKNAEPGHVTKLEKLELYDPEGNQLKAGFSWSHKPADKEAVVSQNKLDVYWQDDVPIPDRITAKVTLSVDNQVWEPLSVDIPIDKSTYADLTEKVYSVNKTVIVDGQAITVERVTVYPTQTEVAIRFDPKNSKRIFGFDNLRLVNEKGESFAFWGNGVSSHSVDEDSVVYYLESSYFTPPEKLYVTADGIRALDKEKLHVVIDAKTGRLLQAPDDRLRVEALRQNEDVVGLDLALRVEEGDLHQLHPLVRDLYDDRGNEYEHVQGTSYAYGGVQYFGELFKRKTEKGVPSTYRFTLSDYPAKLNGDFTVGIK